MSTSSEPAETSQSLDISSSSISPRNTGDGRQLPNVPEAPVPNSNLIKGVHPASNTAKGSNGYGPFLLEYSLMAEYKQVHQQSIPGLYVMPCCKSPLVWSGLIFIRQGLYQGGAFRFQLIIPDNHPDGECPKLIFEYPVFHPLVDPETGEVDVKRAFPRWRRNVHRLWQVLLYAKNIFYNIDTKAPFNPEAAVLYDQEPDLFRGKVSESLIAANERLYQPPALDDPFALRFSQWNEAVHPDAKRQMLNANKTSNLRQVKKKNDADDTSANPSDLGLSWMDSKPPKIFSRDDSGAT